MQINKSKLLGVAFLHLLFLTAVIGITAAIAQTTQKEQLRLNQKAVEYGRSLIPIGFHIQ